MVPVTTTSVSAPEALSPLETRTTPALWRYALDEGRDTPAHLKEGPEGWTPVTWNEAAERVDALGHALLARGVRPGDAVAVLARTRLEWVLLDWAIMSIGAVVVGLYPTNSAKECEYILGHSETVLAFAEDDEQREKLESVRATLPALRDVFLFAALDDLEAEGRAHRGEHPTPSRTHRRRSARTISRRSSTRRERPARRRAACSRTRISSPPRSGSTPSSKRKATSSSSSCRSHTASDASCTSRPRTTARRSRSAPRRCACPRRSRPSAPTVLPAVPRVYEKIHSNALGEIERSGGAKRAIGRWALRAGADASRRRRAGKPVPVLLRLQDRIADRLVFAKVRQRLGGRLRLGISGAAPLGIDVLEFFNSLGLLVVEGYGLTETSSSTTVNEPDDYRFGTVGRPVPGSELMLAEDNEILARGDTIFAGYYKDPEATAATFTEDSWFRTGDVGEIDADGFLKITDRKKDLIITAGGKNIAPQNLENALKGSRFISQAIVIGDRRPYVVALITLDWDEVAASGRDAPELVQEIVDDVNRDRVRVEQIKRFEIVPRDFSQEEGEVTPTMKLRRRVIHENFAAEIDGLYS